jgi:adenylylsulfate kinase-like enzyme
MKGSIYWFTGLAGAGKSTIAFLFFSRLRKIRPPAVFLDGDVLRRAIAEDLGYTRADRRKSAMRNARLCKLLSDQGFDVVCATISMFHECRRWLRRNAPGYREIYVRAPIAVLRERNKKGLYGKRRSRSQVAGIDFPVEEPQSPDVTIENDGRRKPERIVEGIFPLLTRKRTR